MTSNFITTELCVHPTEFCNLKSIALSKLQENIEHTIYSTKYGYIQKILHIVSINFSSICFDRNNGSVCVEILFKALCINPKIGDILECEVHQDENVIFSICDPLHILIRNNTNKSITKGEKIKICVAQTQLNVSNNTIKVLGDVI